MLTHFYFYVMEDILKYLNIGLILVVVFMGIKQGYAMLSGKPEMVDMFGKWDFSKSMVMIVGLLTMLGALLILVPRTFIWGNFMMAAVILMILCFQLYDKNLKGALVELPFLLLNLIIIYLQYPIKSWIQ